MGCVPSIRCRQTPAGKIAEELGLTENAVIFASLGFWRLREETGELLAFTTAPNFPTGGLNLSGSQSTVVSIPAGNIYHGYLDQVTTITFENVSAGETLQI